MEPRRIPPRPPRHPRYDAIHRALLTGLLSNIGAKTETHEYAGPRGLRFSIFPGSSLFGEKARWLVAAELVETTKLYARTCAAVQPQWIERAAAHLVERTYSEPRWDFKSASVVATEKVTLYGLVLVAARTVSYAPINPRVARELFIHHALVMGEYRTAAPFARHNAALVEEVQALEAKIRQRNLLADAATRFAFYDARIPQEITGGALFETWLRSTHRENPRLLFMDKADLLRADAPEITPQNFPDRLSETLGGTGDLRLPLAYRYEPGEVNDGLTLTVPLAALAQLRPEGYEWLVPGMLEEKITVMLRELPGSTRRNFVPVPTWAKAATEALTRARQSPDLPPSSLSLRDALAHFLAHETGLEISAADFPVAAVPPWLRMAFKVLDDQGNVLAFSRDLQQLQRRLAAHAAGSFAAIPHRGFHRDHIAHWDFGDLPDSLTLQRFGMTITAYPALIECGTGAPASEPSCALRLFPSRDAADIAHRTGVRRLFRLEHRRDVKALALHLPQFGQMALQHYTLGDSKTLREELVTLILDRALFADHPPPRQEKDYESLKHKAHAHLHATSDTVVELAAAIIQNYHDLTLAMDRVSVAEGAALSDIREQLAYLLPAGFLLSTPWPWLEHLPRYLAGMRLRLEKLESGGRELTDRDLAAMEKIAPWWNQYLAKKQAHDAVARHDPELDAFRWMLEEYRIHLFAQELGTLMPTSPRRLEKQWDRTKK